MTDRKIVDYEIVNIFIEHSGFERPQDLINKLIRNGYQPYGDLLLNGDNCIQAMVKYEDKEDAKV